MVSRFLDSWPDMYAMSHRLLAELTTQAVMFELAWVSSAWSAAAQPEQRGGGGGGGTYQVWEPPAQPHKEAMLQEVWLGVPHHRGVAPIADGKHQMQDDLHAKDTPR